MDAPRLIERFGSLTSHSRETLLANESSSDEPIRSELFGLQRFEEHGRSLARAQPLIGEGAGAATFFPRVHDNIAALRRSFDYIALTSRSGHYVTPAAEWLLDNFHLVEVQFQQIQEGLPKRYYAQLPKLAGPQLAGLPRIYGIAWAYVAHTDSVLDAEVLRAFLKAYQEVAELRLGELWALPTTLRVVLLENLRRVADGIALSKVARELAHAAWDEQARIGEEELDTLLDLLGRRGLERQFLTQLWQRLPDERSETAGVLAQWLERHCPDGPALVAQAHAGQVAANLTVSNIITTLRLIGQVEWADIIEPVSLSLGELRALPSFSQESERTRQQITHAMERLARQSGHSEREVAQAVVRAASAPASVTDADDADSARRTAGYHLFGPGRRQLAASLRGREDVPPSERWLWRAAPAHWRLALYLLCIALASTAWLWHASGQAAPAWQGWPSWVGMFLLAWPVSEAVISLFHRLVAESVKVRPLPRLDFGAGIPCGHRVLVAIPAMLGSPASVQHLVDQLEQHWLANREEAAQFALLTDWLDADAQELAGDQPLLQLAQAAIRELNHRYPADEGQPPRFLLLHRPRTWCATQRRWIGWERKRGKLEMLLRALAVGDASGFLPQPQGLRLAPGTRYVLTLDSDTGLPPGALRALVSIASHPLNAPLLDAGSRRVVAGYGILQPRVVTPLPQPEERTGFHAMFAGQCGLDPYSHGHSDLYQDVFGHGSFVGKGLLHVQAVHAVLDARLPEQAVLSHDLLEGTVARCAYVSDVALLEDHPHHPGVAASRVHRWMRGDWQLLPLMVRAARYGIDGLGLWKMLDNLRRSLVLPASFALLAWVLYTGALPLAQAFGAVLAALLGGPLIGALAGLVPTRRAIAWEHFLRLGRNDLLRAAAGAAWQFSQLALQAGAALDAIGRAVWRLAVSRRQLLEWTTAAQAAAAARYDLASFVRQHWASTVFCLVLAAAAPWAAHPAGTAAWMLLWALAPLPRWWSSRVRAPAAPVLGLEERRYFETLARDTWRLFERCVDSVENHLPPDNLQMDPEVEVAHRTSPTNVGLYLLAATCARRFGWIGDTELAERLNATLDSLERMAKYKGHLYNWYDTRTLAVLQPAYVSTVDSGNLAGLLLAVARACHEFAVQAEEPLQTERLLRIGQRCDAMFAMMDFRPLYDRKRHLFHIGLRVEEQALDASYYDLLASESRLTGFLAIAKGDVPQRHWAALGRPFLTVGPSVGLKSWSGSMFEYLMPPLLMAETEGGLLHAVSRAAIDEQRAFGAAEGLPWGVSESAYFARDHTLAYQYSPFGVPRLALRRTPAADKVVAPYATVLAAMHAPAQALANLQQLERLGARGEFGFFEAVDFTVARQFQDSAFSVVQTFMAHHQGMSLAALCNLLCGEAPRRWFAASPLVRAHAALLDECAPRQIVQQPDPRVLPEPGEARRPPALQAREVPPAEAGWQPTQLLSNGRYSVALRPSGAGLSRWQSFLITRWRDDALRDQHGSFFYVRREDQQAAVSLTARPAPAAGWRYRARFLADQVQFGARSDELDASITVLVSPEDDVELRTVTLRNTLRKPAVYEVFSYFEAVLAPARADEAHPAFSNLFVQTHWHPQWRALVMERTPRLAHEPRVAAAHFLAGFDAQVLSVECLADRRSFLGRNGSVARPALLPERRTAEGALVNGLDPIACLVVRVKIAPGAVARLSFATAAAGNGSELTDRIDKYLQPAHVERARRMASTLAQVRLRDLGLAPEESAALQDLATLLLYTTPRPVAERSPIDQRQLWRFGISGDKPIVLVRIHSPNGLPLVHALLRALSWWAFGGLAVDVVVLNGEPGSYLMPLERDILALRDRMLHATQHSMPRTDAAGFHLLRDAEVAPGEKAALVGLARVALSADGRLLERQVAALKEAQADAEQLKSLPQSSPQAAPPPREPVPVRHEVAQAASAENPPRGSFDAKTGEFRFALVPGRRPARPWVNVIANPGFGFQVSETGSGYSWAVNSRMYQLTAWSNDPVRDPPSEHWLLEDIDSGEVLGLTPNVHGTAPQRSEVRHGQGYTVFELDHGALAVETTFLADLEDAVKLVHVRLRQRAGPPRRLRAIALAEWQMGSAPGERRTVQTWKAGQLPALFAQQREGRAGFGGATAFALLAAPQALAAWTCDRGEFFDGLGRLRLPLQWASRSGSGLDPCAALACELELPAGEGAVEFCFVLGHAGNAEAALALAERWQQADAQAALARVQGYWSGLLGTISVRTPDPLFDALVNRWLLYQTVASRLWSKAGFYQAGGAFGYRDQLQDAMALALADPARLRRQIVLHASRQFPEGDVQHWWHAPGGEGVRTHFSDDLLWLPYACAHYVETTGDAGVLDEVVPFLEGPAIPEGAEDAYFAPTQSALDASVYEHAARTIDRSLPVGAHGLPLMGTGDWNDGMNRVGHEGRGESVWLAWFLCSVVERFAPLAEARGDAERAQRWRAAREGWIAALHGQGWDGAWFRRAFFDNGVPLGSAANAECRIDLIAQAWAVLSDASTPAFSEQAMRSLQSELVDPQAGLLHLLAPPLQRSADNPGYIQAYPPGVRENGGQYSHAAVWALMAQALQGDHEAAWESFCCLSPAHRSAHPQRGPAYELEPYVMAGDVYGAPPYVGRGGWSWYTGSAAWLYRAAVEVLLGLEVRPGRIRITPRLPSHWHRFDAVLRVQGRELHIAWRRSGAQEVGQPAEALHLAAYGEWIELDGLPHAAGAVVLHVRGVPATAAVQPLQPA